MMKKLWTIPVLLSGLLFTTASMAQSSLYMRVPGLTGEVQAANYRGWIEVTSFSLGYQKATCNSLSVSKNLDMTSPALTVAAVAGTFYPTVTLVSVRDVGDSVIEDFKLRLFNAAVISVSQSGSGGDRPYESLEFLPTSVEVTYVPVSGNGQPLEPVVSTVDCQTVKVK